MRFLRTTSMAAAGSIAMLVATHIGAAALGPYGQGSSGYDYSSPQCGTPAPTGPAFGIVGVNAGYPFTYYNTCLASEYTDAAQTGNAALYVNTGYSRLYTRIDGTHTTQDCATLSAGVTATAKQRAAWAVGCSEAERDFNYASQQLATSPVAWWLDVETANSWSTNDLSLNRYTILGLVTELRTLTSSALPIGIYSTPSMWSTITGGYQPPVDATWYATGQSTLSQAAAYCTKPNFITGKQIWLVQWVSGYDQDYAC